MKNKEAKIQVKEDKRKQRKEATLERKKKRLEESRTLKKRQLAREVGPGECAPQNWPDYYLLPVYPYCQA